MSESPLRDDFFQAALDGMDERFSGDFYREPDDVVRGVTMDLQWQAPAFFLPEGAHSHGGFGLTVPGPPCLAETEKASPDPVTLAERFQLGDTPPAIPSDDLFQLGPATAMVSGMPPVFVGNQLLDLLRDESGVTVSRVSRKKFSVKAAVCSHLGACDLKVRVFRQCPGGEVLAIEFRRRQGDSIVFADIYGRVADRLKEKLAADFTSEPKGASPWQWIDEPAQHSQNREHFEPLFDMAQAVDNPTLQAEAASALLRATERGGEARHALLSERGLEALFSLLTTSLLAVAAPAAKLLLLLAGERVAAEAISQQAALAGVPETASGRDVACSKLRESLAGLCLQVS